MTSEDSNDCKHTCFIYLPDVWIPFDKWLCLHPKYRTIFYQTIEQLFYGSGPMAICERHYIALMAASRHRCYFLMDLHGREFERTGGKSEWLKGLSYASEKIQNIDVLNTILAHQPWSTNVDHLAMLIKCCSPANWCLSELVQASIVLAQTHVLCSFILGNDIKYSNESSLKVINDQKKWIGNSSSGDGGGDGGVDSGGDSTDNDDCKIEVLLGYMEQLKKSQLNNDVKQTDDEAKMQMDFLKVQNDCDEIKSTNSVKSEEILIAENRLKNNCMKKNSMENSIISDNNISTLYTFNNHFGYVDFAQCAEDGFTRTHKIHEFSWEDQGYSCVDELYNEMADILDKKMTLIQNLTYSTMGAYSDVDTSKYRNAIWMYIQSLYGIRHDDYNYAEVNIMLNRKMKTFIKMTCCHPHQITDSLRQSVMIDFRSSEKVHVLLIMMEARLQAELIYFFRALVKFNNSSTVA